MDVTKELLQHLADYVCPAHGDITHFKIAPQDDSVVDCCCELCRVQIETMITDAE